MRGDIGRGRWRGGAALLLLGLAAAWILLATSSGREATEVKKCLRDAGDGPPLEYERLRRQVYSESQDLWHYVSSELGTLAEETGPDTAERVHDILHRLSHRKRSLLSSQERLPEADGFQRGRRREVAAAGELVQSRLRALQSPDRCRTARKALCHLHKDCGFGCQLHHIVYCLVFAYATERTLILDSTRWSYSPRGWEAVFEPLSQTCTSIYDDDVHQWAGNTTVPNDAKVISLPLIDSIEDAFKPGFMPLAIPKDLAHRISRFNGDPSSWWVGQLVRFVLRPRPAAQRAIDRIVRSIPFTTPIVGVHIRRTDKVGSEAALHHLTEYMAAVGHYYSQHGGTTGRPRVYIATNDPQVLVAARAQYKQYSVLGSLRVARSASQERRMTPPALLGLLADLQLLARTDHLVCTFSSQVCRLAYEMMQASRVDASDAVWSLDDIYYFGGQRAHHRVAIATHARHMERNEIDMEPGDFIGVAGNHWNGYGLGTNRRTRTYGLFPWYKTADHLELYPFPEYRHVSGTSAADRNAEEQNMC